MLPGASGHLSAIYYGKLQLICEITVNKTFLCASVNER
jgi:hypothetical protein